MKCFRLCALIIYKKVTYQTKSKCYPRKFLSNEVYMFVYVQEKLIKYNTCVYLVR